MPFRILKTREFAAPQPVEIATTLRPTRASPFRLTPMVQVDLGPLLAGDIINVTACQAQVSSKIPHWAMVGTHLILCDSPRISAAFSQNDFGRWVEITEAQTTNIINTIHHHPVRTSARYVVTDAWENAYLTFLMYSAFPDWDNTEVMVVDRDYGRLEGYVQRAVTPAELAEFLTGVPAPAPPAPAPEPPPPTPAPEPEPEMVMVSMTRAHADAIVAVAAAIPPATP